VKDQRPLEARPGVWRLRAVLAEAGLAYNAYLVRTGDGFCVVDPGPAAFAEELIRQAAAVTPLSTVKAAVLLDESPLCHSSIAQWSAAGFTGTVLADWRVAEALSASGGARGLRGLREGDNPLPGMPGLRVLRTLEPSGQIIVFCAEAGTLFSGRAGSSAGTDLPDVGADATLDRQKRFAAEHGHGGLLGDTAGLLASPPLLCPRFGSLLPGDLARAVIAGAHAAHAGTGSAESRLSAAVLELEAAKASNYLLREAMITANDTALRDAASGLYGRAYADAFLQSIVPGTEGLAAAFIRVDRIKDLNRRVGARAVDVIFKDLAALVQEREPEAMLFRWTGPVLLMILKGVGDRVFERLDALRLAVTQDKRFVHAVTVSIALVRGEELEGDAFARLQQLARERLKLLDLRGGNAILDRSDIPTEEKAFVLALDPDPLFLDFLVESLVRDGFHTVGISRGGEALALMERTNPELVIADLSLPQFDAFQIRMRMQASKDLNDVPFVLIASRKTDEMIARAHSLSIYHVLEKPVSMVELVGIARSLLSRSSDGA
jgi:PleD family two-component response regulator